MDNLSSNKKVLVKYHNNLNKVCLKNITAGGLDLLMVFFSKISENEINLLKNAMAERNTVLDKPQSCAIGQRANSQDNIPNIWKYLPKEDLYFEMTDEEIRNLLGKDSSQLWGDRLRNRINQLKDSLHDQTITVEDADGNEVEFNIFPTTVRSRHKKTTGFFISKGIVYLFRGLEKNFTAFELSDFLKIKGKYAKILYMQQKGSRGIGYFELTFPAFQRLCGISELIKAKEMSRIASSAIKEIKKFDQSIEYTAQKGVDGKLVSFRADFSKTKKDLEGVEFLIWPNSKGTTTLPGTNINPRGQHKNKALDYPQREYSQEEMWMFEFKGLGRFTTDELKIVNSNDKHAQHMLYLKYHPTG